MDEAQSVLLHGACVVVAGHGVLILGKPGSGKSDLALRLIDQAGSGIGGKMMTARLVADDQVVVRMHEGRLLATPPPTLAGKLEIRGLGIVEVDHAQEAVLALAVRLADASAIERLPEAGASAEILGVRLPEIAIDPRAASAPARVRAAVMALAAGPLRQ